MSRTRWAALRGLLIACCAAASTAALITGPVPASGAVPLPGSGAVAAPAQDAGAAAADTTPPSEPGMLGTTSIYHHTALGLVWTPSTDDTGVTGYEVYTWTHSSPESVTFTRGPLVTVRSTAEQIVGYTHSLVPDRAYLAYVVAVDAAGNRSVPSLLAMGTAMAEPPNPYPTPRPQDPPAVANLRDHAGIGPGFVGLDWESSPSSTTSTWTVFRRSSSEWSYVGSSRLPRTMARVGDEPSYTFQVVTRDDLGRLSRPSNAAAYVTPSPTPTPDPATCAVAYKARVWSGGFTADVTVRNTGTAPITGWRLEFRFPSATQRLVTGWSAAWTQTGTAVSATSLAWNKTIRPGRSTRLGLSGTFSGSNPSPTAFTLNGNPCTVK